VRLLLVVLVLALPGVAARTPVQPLPNFAHVVVIVFENKAYGAVIGSPQAPTFNRIGHSYATLTNYDAVSHPSLPNYLALVSGSTHGIAHDCTSCHVSGLNLADMLERAHKTWKLYAEGLPHPGYTGASADGYAKKHDPFVYFRDIAASPTRLANIVPLSRLQTDLSSGQLPDFAFVVPDECHSMHDCTVATGDAWLRRRLPPLLGLPDTVVFIVFDEGTSIAGGGGHVPALAAGAAVKPHSPFTSKSSHYALLRTIEDAWGLRRLGRSAQARPISGIWR
jgi:hypothetical protein